MSLPPIPTFLDKVSETIQKKKLPVHKYCIINSVNVYRINTELVNKEPLDKQGEMRRFLLWQWGEGQQTLLGLKALVKDQCLVYTHGTLEEVLRQLHAEMDFGIKWVLVPENIQENLFDRTQYPNLVSYEKCLFFD